MLLYMFIFLLVNTHSRSLGVPVPLQQANNGKIMIGNLLNELAKGCKNEFVSKLISSKMNECNLEVPPIRDVQMQCLIFYDASSLLCNLATAEFPKLAEDFALKTKEKQDVSAFCVEASHLKLPPTKFQTKITLVFQDDTPCKKVCADADILITDTNFVCKYYKWMLGKVTPQIAPVEETLASHPLTDVQGKLNDTSTNAGVSDTNPKIDESPSDSTKLSSTNPGETNQLHVDIAQQESSSLGQLSNPKQGNQAGTVQELKPPVENVNDTVVSEKKPEDEVPKPGSKLEPVLPPGDNINVIEPPNQDNGFDGNDDDGSMDDNEDPANNIDNGGEDTDDLAVDLKLNHGNSGPVKQAETQINNNGESSHADIYPNAIDGFTEDDDHFFPFFLTAVIVVVVLYVLYHNKNKVGKMFFGLIVEGRQSGRRRNSRGHAYRRLDTLEQAMSANTAAPPSKIIY